MTLSAHRLEIKRIEQSITGVSAKGEGPAGGMSTVFLEKLTSAWWDSVSCSTKKYSVMLGTSKLKPENSSTALIIPVKDIIIHPKFWGRTFIMGDIALLQLSTPVTFSKYVQPICLPEPNDDLKIGTPCWVTGWGQVKQRFIGE